MQPVPHISVQPAAVAAPFTPPSLTPATQGEKMMSQASASNPAAPMSWQQRREFYLQRNELNQAVEASEDLKNAATCYEEALKVYGENHPMWVTYSLLSAAFGWIWVISKKQLLIQN